MNVSFLAYFANKNYFSSNNVPTEKHDKFEYIMNMTAQENNIHTTGFNSGPIGVYTGDTTISMSKYMYINAIVISNSIEEVQNWLMTLPDFIMIKEIDYV